MFIFAQGYHYVLGDPAGTHCTWVLLHESKGQLIGRSVAGNEYGRVYLPEQNKRLPGIEGQLLLVTEISRQKRFSLCRPTEVKFITDAKTSHTVEEVQTLFDGVVIGGIKPLLAKKPEQRDRGEKRQVAAHNKRVADLLETSKTKFTNDIIEYVRNIGAPQSVAS